MTVVGATVPIESLRQLPRASEKYVAKSAKSDPPSDPMAETPEGLRVGEKLGASSTQSSAPEARPSKSSAVWTILALLVFAGGATFAYVTFFGGERPKDKAVPSARASGSSKVEPPKVPTAKPKPSASASAAPVTSAEPVVDAGEIRSDAAVLPAPEDMTRIAGASFAMGEGGTSTRISKDFFIDKYEVTLRSYKECLAARKCPWLRVINVTR